MDTVDNLFNIHNTNYLKKNILDYKNRGKKRFEGAMVYNETGIIPNYFNAIYDYDKSHIIGNKNILFNNIEPMKQITNNKDYMKLYNLASNFNNQNKNTAKIPRYFKQFDEMKFDTFTTPKPGSMNTTSVSPSEQKFSGFNENKNMTYGIFQNKDLVHNNMLPFNKGKTYGNSFTEHFSDCMQQRNNFLTGNPNALEYKPRIERKPLFNPSVGLTWAGYGMPDMTYKLDGRFEPGKERRNEFPVTQSRVTPGLNLGYNEIGTVGFHDTFRVLPKTIDDMRTLDNPRYSYTPPVNSGEGYKKGPITGDVKKRSPTSFYEMSEDDLYPQGTDEKAPLIDGQYVLDPTQRMVNNGQIIGTPVYQISQLLKSKNYPKSHIPLKENYLEGDPTGRILAEGGFGPSNRKSYSVENTQRSIAPDTKYIGTSYNAEHNSSYVLNTKDWIPNTTTRNLTELNNRTGTGIYTGERATQPLISRKDIPDFTLNDIYINNQRAGMGNYSAEHNRTPLISRKDIPDFTLNDIYINNQRAGMGNYLAEHNKGNLISRKDIPDFTLNDMYIDNQRAGMGNYLGELSRVPLISRKDIPDFTLNDIYIDNQRAGIGNYMAEHNKPRMESFKDIPDFTIKETTAKNDYITPMGSLQYEKPSSEELMKNVLINTNKGHFIGGRAPTLSSVTKGPYYDHTKVELCEKKWRKGEMRLGALQTLKNRMPTVISKQAYRVPNAEYHFNDMPYLSLKGNPYVNNILDDETTLLK